MNKFNDKLPPKREKLFFKKNGVKEETKAKKEYP